MEIFKPDTRINFLGKRGYALVVSLMLVGGSIGSLWAQGLNFGIDFSGGTLVEVGYQEPVEIESVRGALQENNFNDAVVQHFGTSRDVLVRLPAIEGESEKAVETSERVIQALRTPFGETLADSDVNNPQGLQQCVGGSKANTEANTAAGAETDSYPTADSCQVQMRRVEFVGPQVGDELTNQGSLAMLYALIGILIYVTFRFEWRFAVGSVLALAHDVIITLGVFSLFQFDFSLPVLAAVLAVIGYSLNDTIVVYDRIRENFRKLRSNNTIDIMNVSINQTLPRTVLTSLTTMVVVLTLLIFGGEVIRGFSIALLVGVIIGTYSSIFVASPAVMALGITREDMLLVPKEGADTLP